MKLWSERNNKKKKDFFFARFFEFKIIQFIIKSMSKSKSSLNELHSNNPYFTSPLAKV